MTESEYALATNKVKIKVALTEVKDIFPGIEFGITKEQQNEILKPLYSSADRIHSLLKTAMTGY